MKAATSGRTREERILPGSRYFLGYYAPLWHVAQYASRTLTQVDAHSGYRANERPIAFWLDPLIQGNGKWLFTKRHIFNEGRDEWAFKGKNPP